jgi:hypothetical protein
LVPPHKIFPFQKKQSKPVQDQPQPPKGKGKDKDKGNVL